MIYSSFNMRETKIQRKIWIHSLCHFGLWPKSNSTCVAAPWHCPLLALDYDMLLSSHTSSHITQLPPLPITQHTAERWSHLTPRDHLTTDPSCFLCSCSLSSTTCTNTSHITHLLDNNEFGSLSHCFNSALPPLSLILFPTHIAIW